MYVRNITIKTLSQALSLRNISIYYVRGLKVIYNLFKKHFKSSVAMWSSQKSFYVSVMG